jgi:hypothetical protein
VSHLLKLYRSDIDKESPEYLSAYRSFEGEVFENYMYEKLIRYAITNDEITSFVLKGMHTKKSHAQSNTLSTNRAGQIVYRTNRNEIGEFDALFFMGNTLHFVEITLTSSVVSLRKRLRKKKALLEVLFPKHDIKSLIILNEGVSGVKALPDYCDIWITKPFSAQDILKRFANNSILKRAPFKRVHDDKFVDLQDVHIFGFKYYNTLFWILKILRKSNKEIINDKFFHEETFVRYHELYTKVYLGYITYDEFSKLCDISGIKRVNQEEKFIVSIEKEHTGKFTLVFFMQHKRYDLDMIYINDDGSLKISKKDPYGITVNEVTHITKMMKKHYVLTHLDTLKAKEYLDLNSK